MTPARASAEWPRRLESVLADPSLLRLHFQPIVDLRRGVVAGYETLARFCEPDGQPSRVGPDRWFAAAGAQGAGARLEGLVVRRCLELLPTVPPNCFLTVNVSPHLLTDPELAGTLLAAPDLAPLVLELTEHQDVTELEPLLDLRDRLRSRGALLAVDDAGSGYSGLQQIAAIKPQMVKLDRAIVSGVDGDEVKLALTELLGEFAGRIDAWLLAEGLETAGELAAFMRLGVPLGQGWVLGRPAPGFAPLAPEVVRLIKAQAARVRLTESVASLLRPVRQVEVGDDVDAPPPAVVVGPLGEPLELLLRDPRTAETYTAPVSPRVHPSADIAETLQRALTRPPAQRFDPVLCTDPAGQVLGLVRVEDLASAAHVRR